MAKGETASMTTAVIELIVAWLPLVVLMIAWALFMRRANRQYKSHVDQVNSINAEIRGVNQEMLVELRAIRAALERSKS